MSNFKKALVVDDQPIQRIILHDLLTNLGYEVIDACNGVEAIEIFTTRQPDMIFMDVMMPIMDGLEAARKIKSTEIGRFTPIIFLTALTDPSDIRECIDAGGDDFLSKPVNPDVLKTRIIALERIRDLYNLLHQEHTILLKYIDKERDNNELAKCVMDHALMSKRSNHEGLYLFNKPADTFSGDILLNARMPSGKLRILLGDFTGHGLASAMVSLPVSEIFHSMTCRDLEQTALLSEINKKLCRLLPDDRFMAATVVDIDPSNNELIIWSGGMPDSLLLNDQEEGFKISGKGIALGIIDDYNFSPDQVRMNFVDMSRLLLLSDGFQDLRNKDGVTMKKSGHYQSFLNAWRLPGSRLGILVEEFLQKHCEGHPLDDDVSLVEIKFSEITST